MTDKETWCAAKNVREGVPYGVERDGRRYVVCHKGDAAFALDGACPHRGAPLEDGFFDGAKLVCPWHGWSFDVETGLPRFGDYGVTSRRLVERDGAFVDAPTDAP
jgi:nitrite reductase/ring-hydroxylating ferredoxin subunit